MSIPGTSSADPLKLCPCMHEYYTQVLEAVDTEPEILPGGIVLIETLRDVERQEYYIKHGVSRTMHSLHLPQPPNGLSLAFDICPRAYLNTKNWSPGGGLWDDLADIALSDDCPLALRLGVTWGGEWEGWKDYPHFQIDKCGCSLLAPTHPMTV